MVDRFKTGSAGVVVEGRGTLDRRSAGGDLSLTANAPSLVAMADALSPFSPDTAARLKAMSNEAGPAQARLSLRLAPNKAKGGQVQAAAELALDAPQLSGSARFEATPKASDIKSFDLDTLAKSEVTAKAALAAPQAQTLLALAGLDGAVSAGGGAGKLDLSGSGRWRAAIQLKAHLTGIALDLAAEGKVEPWAAEPKAALMVRAPRLDLLPLLGLDPQGGDAGRISLASRLAVAGKTWTFNDIDAGVGDGRMRGRLVVTRGDRPTVEGEAGFDSISVAPAVQLAIGAAGRDRDAPLGRGLTSGWRGKVTVHALTAGLPGGSKLQPLDGVLRSDGQALTLETTGKLGGGEAAATLTARPGDGGLALTGKVSLNSADGSALHYGDLVTPAGKATLKASLASTGRSAAALMGALSGGGTLTLDHAELPGLGVKAFEVEIAAGDAGQAIDDRQLSAVVEPALANGKLALDNAQFPLSLSDGRLSIAATSLQSQGVRAVVAGGYDIPAGQADLRATLTMADAGPGAAPEIRIFAAGPPDHLVRTVDLSALSSWLAVRRIDRETKKLQALERQAAPASTPAAPADATPKPGETDSGRPQVAPESAKPESAKPGPAQPSPAPLNAAKPDAPKPDANAATQPPAPAEPPAPKPDSAKDDSAVVSPTPLPDADPRRVVPKPRPQPPRVSPPATSSSAPHAIPPQRPASPPNPAAAQAAHEALRERAAPLPPPLEIKPAPGDARPTRLRPPVNLAPATSPY
ncbi:AsmA-like C-terminal region-containing protein [Rhodopseudomonas sp. B29]|uniref:AsmA-like C-terminal region-containing protein n=1 Tax=Rhodopseudomonas sp. B29 TaxID=95607 RepID=UPI0003481F31|nr:AsmA-like C-terminal region-containing protein [Rhodopseudomonas sp. B29]